MPKRFHGTKLEPPATVIKTAVGGEAGSQNSCRLKPGLRAGLLQQLDHLFHRFLGFHEEDGAAAGLDLDFALGEGALADADAEGEAHEVGVLELDAGAFVTVVEDGFHAARGEVGVDLLG